MIYSGDAARTMNKLSHLRHDLLNVYFCDSMNVPAHDDIKFWSYYVNFFDELEIVLNFAISESPDYQKAQRMIPDYICAFIKINERYISVNPYPNEIN